MNLEGKTALVVGGTGDIGHATARLFLRNGATTVITGRERSRVNARTALLGSHAKGATVDPNDEAQLRSLFADLGGVDFLVLTLGTQALTMPFSQITEEQIVQGFTEKFLYYTRTLRAGWGKVRESVTWLTGAAACVSVPGLSNYAAPNGALHAMLGSLAMELAPVRINCVAAGLTRTNFWSALGMPAAAQAAMYADAKAALPLKRHGEPEDIAQALFFAATNTYVSGTVLVVDGGLHLGRMSSTAEEPQFGSTSV